MDEPSIMTRRASGVGVVALLLFALAGSAGCRATWTPATLAPPSALQWPFAPGAAKVVYSHAMTGIARDTSAGTVLSAVVFGSDPRADSFVLPVAVATGSDGRMAVADTGCSCVHLYLPATAKYQRLTGNERSRLTSPVGVAFDDDNRLYVSDSGGALFSFDAGGQPRFALRKVGDQDLLRPTGLVWSSSRRMLFLVDTLAHSVRGLNAAGALQRSFGGRGNGPGQLNFPTHIAESGSGELYVTDALNFRVAIFDGDGRSLGGFGHHGDGSGDIAMPKGIAVDAEGVVYVVDALFDNVQLFNRRGDFLLTLGARGTGFGEFWLPAGTFLDRQGRLYVCDTYNHRIQVFRVEKGYATGNS